MKKRQKNPEQRSFTLIFSLCVFLILLVILLLFSAGTLILQHSGLSEYVDNTSALPFIFCALASIAIGSSVTPLILRIPLGPVNRLINGMARLAHGHYDERIDLGNITLMKELSNSFNTLAGELQNTEMLRTDFINNFSHEFKTPIVSIRGFARLLQKRDLPEEQRRAYLDIIVDESTRLSNLATNVLNLTKVENQQILTDVSSFNLSEQLRRCILLLEKDWSRKEISIVADFGEFHIEASEELLRQVWLNLLDNAVKFSSKGSSVTVQIYTSAALPSEAGSLQVDVTNHGPCIPPEQQERIFDKFYQGDASHAAEGAGVGLSVVKKIVELHRGQVLVRSSGDTTTFSVLLPVKA